MKITCIIPHENHTILNMRGVTRIRPDEPQWKDWTITVRGPSVFIISPPGYTYGKPAEGTKRQVCQIPLARCNVEWEMAEGERVEEIGVVRGSDVRADSSGGAKK